MRGSDSEARPRISVLIGTRNRPEVLKRCLRSILEQDYINFEVLVLDDASDSLSVCDLIREFKDSRIRCFRAHAPLGVAGGRNRLMELAEGDVFCVIDDDAYLDDPQALSKIAEVFSRNPDVGIVAVKVIDHRGRKTGLLLPFPKWALIHRPSLADEETDVSYYLGTCHAIKRRVIEVCGPYRPDLVYGGEELDLSYRAVQAGFRIRYIPDIIAHHYPQDSVVKNSARLKNPELFYHVRNRFLLAKKYLPIRFAIFYLPFWMLIYLIFAFQSRAISDFGRGVWAGIQLARKAERTPLSRQSIGYLRKHYGRLWY